MIHFLEIVNIQNMINEIETTIKIRIPRHKGLIFLKF